MQINNVRVDLAIIYVSEAAMAPLLATARPAEASRRTAPAWITVPPESTKTSLLSNAGHAIQPATGSALVQKTQCAVLQQTLRQVHLCSAAPPLAPQISNHVTRTAVRPRLTASVLTRAPPALFLKTIYANHVPRAAPRALVHLYRRAPSALDPGTGKLGRA